MLRGLLTILLLIGSTTNARAENLDQTAVMFDTAIAMWVVQQSAAEHDVELVDQTYVAFLNAFGENRSAADVDTMLQPLRLRYPDYRLNFIERGDYCQVSRAIIDARSAAISRVTESLAKQSQILILKSAFTRILLSKSSAELRGAILTDVDVSVAITAVLNELMRESIRTDWGAMDVLTVAPAEDDRTPNCD
jgi:hypothetical protein